MEDINSKEHFDEIVKEEHFPCVNMDKHERDFILYLMENSLDFQNSKYSDKRNGEILEMRMYKEDDKNIRLNGTMIFEAEIRYVSGYASYAEDEIILELDVEKVLDNKKFSYSTLDAFKKADNGYDVKSFYLNDINAKEIERKI